MKENFILTLYKNPQTVFTLKELSLMFPKISYISLKNKISYALRTEKLLSLRKGIYGKREFNFLELANKIYTPSYISLETVLAKEGIIFQHYQTIFVVSYLSRRIKVSGREIFYRKIKNDVLLNKTGIDEEENFFIASKERAFIDAVFLYKDYHFDNLKPLDWEKINLIKNIYSSRALNKRLEEYYKIYQTQDVGQK